MIKFYFQKITTHCPLLSGIVRFGQTLTHSVLYLLNPSLQVKQLLYDLPLHVKQLVKLIKLY